MIIGKNIITNENVKIDLDNLIETRCLISANSGGGKSFLARKLMEEAHGKVQVLIIDLEGEFASLREKYDYLLVGKDGEIPANIRTAELLAKRLLELNVSTIIDLSELKHSERITFVKRFLDSLINSPKELWHNCLIFLDEAHQFCLSEDTEILTPDGWKKYYEIKVNDIAVSFNPTLNLMELKPIQAVIIRQHDGVLSHLYNEDSIDALVTDDHRNLCQKRTTKINRKYGWSNLQFIQTKNLPTGIRIPVCSNLSNQSKCLIEDDLLRIMGWIITDGNKSDNKYYQITQATSNKNKPLLFKKMESVIKSTFPKAKGYVRKEREGHKESVSFNLGIDATKIMDLWMNNHTHRIPRNILITANNYQLKILFDSLIEGDGHTHISKNNYSQVIFYCGYNNLLADEFQELSLRLGYSAIKTQLKVNNQIIVKVSFKRRYASVRKISKEIYIGKVWDITIDNGAFVCRRNGKPFITGNCPQGTQSESTSAVIDLMTRGRKRGFCGVLLSQRISKLHKDACAEANNRLIGRTVLDIDRKRASEELGFNTKDQERSLRDLEAGEFYAFGTAISKKEIIKVKIGEVKTTHLKVGGKGLIKPLDTPENIKKLLKDLTNLPKEADEELRSVEDMKKKIRELKYQLTIAEKPKTTERIVQVADKEALQKAKQEGFQEAEKYYKIREQKEQQKKESIRKAVIELNKFLETQTTETIKPVMKPVETISVIKQGYELPKQIKDIIPTEGTLRAGAMKMLNWLGGAHPNSLTKSRLATLSGFSQNGGTFNTYISELKRNGWIMGANEFTITEEGLRNAQAEEIPNGEELLRLWQSKFREGAGKILKTLYDKYPERMTKEEIGYEVGFEPTGGTFNTYISELRRNNLIQVEGNEIKISEEFFE